MISEMTLKDTKDFETSKIEKLLGWLTFLLMKKRILTQDQTFEKCLILMSSQDQLSYFYYH
jgi:hypothetical protein